MMDYRARIAHTWLHDRHALTIQGLEGGSVAYALQQLSLIDPKLPTLIICATSKSAHALKNDVAIPLSFFPAPDHLPYHPLTPSPDIWLQRLKILNEWTRRAPFCCVAPVTAVLRATPPPDIFNLHSETLTVGVELNLTDLLQRLVTMGHTATPLVEEPGNFSRRGGILDIWPVGSPQPARLEFDGDTIISLRHFDPESQRSASDATGVTIIPAHNLCYSADDVATISARLKAAADAVDFPANKRRALVEALQHGRRLPVMETLLPLFYEQRCDLLDYLPPQARIIIVDPAAVRSEADDFAEKLQHAYTHAEEIDRAVPPTQLYRPWSEWRAALTQPVCTLGGLLLDTTADVIQVQTESTSGLRTVLTATGKGDIMPALADHCRAALSSGSSVIMTTHTPLQADRLLDLLRWQGLNPVQHLGPLFVSHSEKAQLLVAVNSLSQGFSWPAEKILCLTEEEIFGRKLARKPKSSKPLANFISFADLNEGDHLVHVDHGVGRYRQLTHMVINKVAADYLLLEYLGGDKLYLPVYRLNQVQRYIGPDDAQPSLDKLGGQRWSKAKTSATKSIRVMAGELLKIYAQRKLQSGFAFGPRDEAFEAFEAAFPYDETPDQWDAIEAVLADMQKPEPMDRLVCGDVGFGKTEIAMRAAYRAALDGKQVAVLVPTTILAYQHYQTFTQRFKDTGVRIAYLNRFVSRADQQQILADCAAGHMDIVIGTHRIIQKDLVFKRLGLLVIDEEHRFGVAQKEKIRQWRATVDTLCMSATPIPRTLHMSLSGLRDISVIRTPPMDRQAIRTYIAEFNDPLIREVVLKELARGGQFFFLHNRVDTIYNMADHLQRLIPEAKFTVAHGQMHEHDLEKAMLSFTRKESDGLLCTTIIESGLDIPSANTILVNRADAFGLSQLYQIRGRVGRSNVQAYAYLLTPEGRELTEVAEKRLGALQRHTELGSGFSIAMHDLEIRGGGNMLGAQQSGHISEIGYEMFTQLLERTIRELQGEAQETVIDPEIQIPVSAFLPDTYISDPQLRLVCYKKLADVESAAELDMLTSEWMDRFGTLPAEAQNLLQIMEVKLLAKDLRMEQVQYDGQWINFKLHESTPINPQLLLRRVQDKPTIYQIRPNSTFRVAAPGLSGTLLFSELRRVMASLQGK